MCSDGKFTLAPWNPFDYLPPLMLTLFFMYIAPYNLHTFILSLDLNHRDKLIAFLHVGFSTSYIIAPPRFSPDSLSSVFMLTTSIRFLNPLNSWDSFHRISSNLSVWHWLSTVLWMVWPAPNTIESAFYNSVCNNTASNLTFFPSTPHCGLCWSYIQLISS